MASITTRIQLTSDLRRLKDASQATDKSIQFYAYNLTDIGFWGCNTTSMA